MTKYPFIKNPITQKVIKREVLEDLKKEFQMENDSDRDFLCRYKQYTWTGFEKEVFIIEPNGRITRVDVEFHPLYPID